MAFDLLYDFIACAGAKDQLDDAPADAAQIGGCHHLRRITTRVLTSGDSPNSNAFELQLVLQLRCEQRALDVVAVAAPSCSKLPWCFAKPLRSLPVYTWMVVS